jgi:hypothetical protein
LGAALTCACGGAALIALAPPSPILYAGALARIEMRPAYLWGLRAAVVATAPLAGAGPAAYALLALAETMQEPIARAARPDWRRALGTGLIGLGFVLGAVELGLSAGAAEVLWPVLLASAGLSAFWWSGALSPSVRRTIGAVAAVVLLFYGGFAVDGPDTPVLAGIGGALVITLVVAPRWLRSSCTTPSSRRSP